MYFDIYSDAIFDLALENDYIVNEANSRMFAAIEADLGRSMTQFERENFCMNYVHGSKEDCIAHINSIEKQHELDQCLFDSIMDQARDMIMESPEFLRLEEEFYDRVRKLRGISDSDWQRIKNV